MKDILELLKWDDFIGVSDRIDFAKGIHTKPNTWKGMIKHIKRLLWQLKR
jgi:hypothetical protein